MVDMGHEVGFGLRERCFAVVVDRKIRGSVLSLKVITKVLSGNIMDINGVKEDII